MPVVHAADAVIHDMHGSRFTSYAAPSRGSAELCAWRLDVAPGSQGVTHAVSREEILFVLSGTLHVTLGDGPAAGRARPAGRRDRRPARIEPAGGQPGRRTRLGLGHHERRPGGRAARRLPAVPALDPLTRQSRCNRPSAAVPPPVSRGATARETTGYHPARCRNLCMWRATNAE